MSTRLPKVLAHWPIDRARFFLNFCSDSDVDLKEAESRFVHLETLKINLSSSSFVIRVNLLHP